MVHVIQNTEHTPTDKKSSLEKGLYRALLVILGYEGAGALLGGILLMLEPDGRYMDMPVSIMHGAFSDFMVPGIILFILGFLNSIAFFSILQHWRKNWVVVSLALCAMVIWFSVEIGILQHLHWLHIMWGGPVVIGFVIANYYFLFFEHPLSGIGKYLRSDT